MSHRLTSLNDQPPLDQNEAAPTASRAAFHDIVLTSMSDFLCVWDAVGRIVYANPAMEQLWGVGRDGWYGKTDGELGHTLEVFQLFERQREHLKRTRQAVGGEILFRPPNGGESVWLEYRLSPVLAAPDDAVASVICVARDITLRKQETKQLRIAEAQIKALFDRLVSVQEDERRRIARDLHDQLGQQMTALRMNLEVFRLQSRADATILNQLERTQRLADELDRTIDFLTWELRPDPLHHLGLAPALEQLVRTWAERFGIKADFEGIGGESRLEPDAEINLYRIAQEALHNVAKHAGATKVSVLLEVRTPRVALTIEDNGQGFTASHNIEGEHRLGLVSMRERAELVGGQLEIDSDPTYGTTIIVRVPFRPSV